MMNTNTTPLTKKPEQFASYKTMRLVSTILAYVLLAVLAIVWIYPLLWIVISSFVVGPTGNPTGVPTTYFPTGDNKFGFENYVNLFQSPYQKDGSDFVWYFKEWFGKEIGIN